MSCLDKIIEEQIIREEYESIIESLVNDDRDFLFFDVANATDAIVSDEGDYSEDLEDLEDDDLIDYVDEM